MQFNLPGLAVGAGFFALAAAGAYAADPASGTLNDTTSKIEWTGGPLFVPNQTNVVEAANQEPVCEEGTPLCDVYRFEVNASNLDSDNDEIHVSVGFDDATGMA